MHDLNRQAFIANNDFKAFFMIDPVSITPSSISNNNGRFSAPADSVEYFGQLLAGMKVSLSTSTTHLSPDAAVALPGKTLLEDTALRINKTEVGLQEIEREIQKGDQPMEFSMTVGSDFPKSLVYQQFVSSAYFINLSRVENSASNTTDEIESIVRKR